MNVVKKHFLGIACMLRSEHSMKVSFLLANKDVCLVNNKISHKLFVLCTNVLNIRPPEKLQRKMVMKRKRRNPKRRKKKILKQYLLRNSRCVNDFV